MNNDFIFDPEPGEEECWQCGGSGVLEDDCTCGEDTCCCLEPEPPECPECIYRYRRWRERAMAGDGGAA